MTIYAPLSVTKHGTFERSAYIETNDARITCNQKRTRQFVNMFLSPIRTCTRNRTFVSFTHEVDVPFMGKTNKWVFVCVQFQLRTSSNAQPVNDRAHVRNRVIWPHLRVQLSILSSWYHRMFSSVSNVDSSSHLRTSCHNCQFRWFCGGIDSERSAQIWVSRGQHSNGIRHAA